MSPHKTVTIAGATGNLGPSILTTLLSSGFQIRILSRSAIVNIPNLPSTVTVKEVDFTSLPTLTSALAGQDVLISTLPDPSLQLLLIDAAIAAGVKHFIPSEFGSDSHGNKSTRRLPVFAEKIKTQQYLTERRDQINYTLIINGAFLDWGVKVGFLANLNEGEKTKIYDGGDGKRSMTLLSDVGKAVVGVLAHPEESANRAIYVQSAAVSQNQILAAARRRNPGRTFDVEDVDTGDLERESFAALERGGDVMEAMYGFIAVSIFREGYGGLFSRTDNELLGIKELSEAEVEDVVAQYC